MSRKKLLAFDFFLGGDDGRATEPGYHCCGMAIVVANDVAEAVKVLGDKCRVFGHEAAVATPWNADVCRPTWYYSSTLDQVFASGDARVVVMSYGTGDF